MIAHFDYRLIYNCAWCTTYILTNINNNKVTRSGATTIVFNLNVSGCIIFLLTTNLRSFSIFNKIEAVFHLKKLH